MNPVREARDLIQQAIREAAETVEQRGGRRIGRPCDQPQQERRDGAEEKAP